MTFDEWLEARCVDDGGCLIWRHQVSPSGAPLARSPNKGDPKYKQQVRRMVWENKNGPIPDGMRVTCTCSNPRCLSCLELATPGQIIERMWKQSDVRARRLSSLTKARRRIGKLDMEKARYIRSSTATLEVLAGELGVSMTTVSLVRRGLQWRESSNPFAGLGA